MRKLQVQKSKIKGIGVVHGYAASTHIRRNTCTHIHTCRTENGEVLASMNPSRSFILLRWALIELLIFSTI